MTENVVVNALFRNSRDNPSPANLVVTAVDGFRMEAPGLAAADRPLQDIDGPVEFRGAHGKPLGLRTKVESGHLGESLLNNLSCGCGSAAPTRQPSAET